MNNPIQSLSPRAISLALITLLLTVLSLRARSQSVLETNNLAGDYKLISVNSNAVPCVVHHEDADITVKSGLMVIRADGTCSSHSVFSLPQNPEINRRVEATYTRSGNVLTLLWKGAGRTKGTLDGNTFTINNEGMIFAYQK